MASAAARSSTSGSPTPSADALRLASAPQPGSSTLSDSGGGPTAAGGAGPTSTAAADTPSTSPRHHPSAKAPGSDTSSPSAAPPFRQNGHKSCDACKTRKVKCPNIDYPNPCGNCVRRKEACYFGTKKVPRRNVTKHLRFTVPCSDQDAASSGTMLCYVDAPGTSDRAGITTAAAATTQDSGRSGDGRSGPTPATGDLIPSLYVDHLLAQAQAQTRGKEVPFVKGNGIFGGSYSLTFFSESRLQSLANRLRNNKVNELVRRINGIVSGRLRRGTGLPGASPGGSGPSSVSGGSLPGPGPVPGLVSVPGPGHATITGPILSISSVIDDFTAAPVDPAFAAAWINCYFERVHPMYPFLDRAAFEARALPTSADGGGSHNKSAGAADPDLARSLAHSKAWSALYYTVLAIGCVYSEGGGAGCAGISSVTTAAAARDPFLGSAGSAAANEAGTGGGVGTVAGTGVGGDASASGSFEPGKGTAWRLFSVALASFSDLLILPDSLLTLQALTAMVIYGLGVSCLSIEHVILSEASRRAQSLASNFGTSTSGSTSYSPTFQRTFWVLYGLEKVMSFHFGRSSTFVDSDIACPFPADLEDEPSSSVSASSSSSSYSCAAADCWFLLLVRHARLLSRTYSSLFSVGTARVTAASSLAIIDRLCDEVEAWRLAIPETRGLRPEHNNWSSGSSSSNNNNMSASGSLGSNKNSLALRSANPTERNIALALRYLYHGLIVILARAKLHHLCQLQSELAQHHHSATPDARGWTLAAARLQETEARRGLMVSARGILELTPTIDVEPYMPLWILAVIPLTALFVLFDLVVDHPGEQAVGPAQQSCHQQQQPSSSSGTRPISADTALNLALLDMGAGYFSRIEYASNSSLPGSLISEFAHIARDYVNDYQRGDRSTYLPLPPPPPLSSQHHHQHGRRDSPDDDDDGGGGGADVVHTIPMLQPTTGTSTAHMLPGQQPLPPPPPLMTQQQQQQQQQPPGLPTRQALAGTTAADHQQMNNLMAASSLAAWPGSGAATAQPTQSAASGDGLALVGGGGVSGFTDVPDGLGYGFGANPYQPGSADFSGTDVMGLFTSNHYFLSEMDGLLYNGL